MATSLLIRTHQTTSAIEGGVFNERTSAHHSPPLAATAESTSVINTIMTTSSTSSTTHPISSSSTESATPADSTSADSLVTETSLKTTSVVGMSDTAAASIERRKKKPYKELTLEEKVQLIRLAEQNAGLSQASIAERYAIAKSNVCRILQRKHEYLRAFESAGFAGSRKRKLRGDPDQNSSNASNDNNNSNNTINHNALANNNRNNNKNNNNSNNDSNNTSNNDTNNGNHHTTITHQNQTTTAKQSLQVGPLSNSLNHQYDAKQNQPQRLLTILPAPKPRYALPTAADQMSKDDVYSNLRYSKYHDENGNLRTPVENHFVKMAKEEGKTISVPVIGKGNPPTPQQHNQSSSHHASSNQVVTQQLHNPHAAARPLASTPSNSFFNPLQIHPLPAHQPLSIADPNGLMNAKWIMRLIVEYLALQTAAATLFPQMALLRGTTSTPTATSNSAATTAGAQTDELMMKLRERLMLNNLMAQSGFGLAAWLAALPKVDQSGELNSGIGNLNTTNGDIMNGKEMNNVEMGEEDDEINVDKEIEEQEMRLDRERQNDDDIQTDDSGDGINKRSDKESHSQMNDANDSEENKNSENAQRPRSMKKSTSDDSSSPSNGISSSISNTMPNLRSAIATSPLNSLIYKKRLLHSPSTLSDTLLNIAATQATLPASDQSSDGQDSHVSPTETHSSLSPATESGRECFECSVYKGKLAVAENRCRYLEGRTATLQRISFIVSFQSDALRFSTRVSASESSARQFEQEGRLLREQNELLQRKLLECQEKTLAFMQGDQVANPQAVAFYLNEILKATLLC
ncbi:unnamed protein product [Anisakis simplex]|uniref:HTH psq-type domain-containing protein n=1 Tax=Anisakis simplex TaxID=6269 RepID=A0A0M3K1V4_ANISI|nr:unnamed protein product [Anisakis simplex]